MGGRGSGFKATGSGNEGVRQLNSGDGGTPGPEPTLNEYPNDSITKRDLKIISELKNKRNIVVYKSTDNIEEEFLNKNLTELNNVLETMKNTYKISYKHLIGSGSHKRSSIKGAYMSGAFAAAVRNDGYGRFTIFYDKNSYDGKDAETYLSAEHGKLVDKGFLVKVPTNKYSVASTVHEMGHLVQYALYRRDKKESIVENTPFDIYAVNVQNDILKISTNRYKEINNSVSDYSAYNPVEWFAETFADLHFNGRNNSGLTKALDDYLKGDRL